MLASPLDCAPLVLSLLGEIAEALQKLVHTGITTAIDLASLPLSAADRNSLDEQLGRGEVEAVISAAGDSEIWETAYRGVWWVRHLSPTGAVISEQIEVAAVPAILLADMTDIDASRLQLSQYLDPLHTTSATQESQHV